MQTIINDTSQSRYTIDIDGYRAVADYMQQGERMVITHVGVPKQLENRGIGSALVKFALEDARSRGLNEGHPSLLIRRRIHEAACGIRRFGVMVHCMCFQPVRRYA